MNDAWVFDSQLSEYAGIPISVHTAETEQDEKDLTNPDMTLEEVCKIVEDHYNQKENTDTYIIYSGESFETESGYFLMLRSTGNPNVANELIADAKVNMTTGEVITTYLYGGEDKWNLFEMQN